MSIKQQSCVEAMKQWREALECALSDDKPYIDRCKQAIASIDKAIARAESTLEAEKQPKREWVGLTTAEFDEIHESHDTLHDAMWATITKLKEKNNG